VKGASSGRLRHLDKEVNADPDEDGGQRTPNGDETG
jgi:hypothetical protein